MRLGRHVEHRGADTLGLVPLLELLDHRLDLAGDEGDVGDESFNGGLAEIDAERLEEFGFVLGEHLVHLLELMATPCQRAGGTRFVGRPKSVCNVGHLVSQSFPGRKRMKNLSFHWFGRLR